MTDWHYWRWIGAAAFLIAAAPQAHATPAFAAKEMKPCSYCHVNPRGGGRRNYRGQYYQAHNNSFVGFVDEQAPQAASFHQLWTEILSDKPTRGGVADTVGDNVPRLVVIQTRDAKTRTISIQRWDAN